MGLVGALLLTLIKFLISIWGVATNWLYSLLSNPGEKLRNYSRVLSNPEKTIKDNDTEVCKEYHCSANIQLIFVFR